MQDMSGRVCLVTGSTHGIGQIAAEGLARMGATVVVHGRSPERVTAVCRIIQERTSSREITGIPADFARLEDVRRLANTFVARHERLDVLIDNAGGTSGAYRKTADGFEWHFGVNHLAPFLLTNLLLDRLIAAAPSRIVVVSSEAHRRSPVDVNDLNLEHGYGTFRAYSRSKFANVLFVVELARRLRGTGVTVNALHPGFVDTNLFATLSGLPRWLYLLIRPLALSPEQGAKTSIYLASSPKVAGVSGRYFSKCRETAPSGAALDSSLARQLWEKSEALTGLGRSAA